MNHLKIIALIALPLSVSFASCHSGGNAVENNSDSTAIKINLSDMKQIGTVDERFQSYNVEMVEVVGGGNHRA